MKLYPGVVGKVGLGTSPISSVPYVLSLKFTWMTFGEWTLCLNLFFFLLEWILLKKKFSAFQFLQIPIIFVFSWTVNAFMDLLGFIQNPGIPVALLLLAAGCAVLDFGVTVEVTPDLIMVPADGIFYAISNVFAIPLGKVKNFFDLFLICVSLCLSFLFFGRLNGIGIETVIAAILVGRFISLFKKFIHFEHIL